MTAPAPAGQHTRPRHDPHRAELIGALRDTARWLEDNPGVPITRYIAAIRMIQAQAFADRAGQTGDAARRADGRRGMSANTDARMRPWPGQPETCTCTQEAVATLEETLACPLGWQWVPGTGWTHAARSAA